MNPILKLSLFIRLFLTPALYFTKNNIFHTVILLVILDIIDCNPLIIKLGSSSFKKDVYCSNDENYELLDKLLDAFQNFSALFLLRLILPIHIFKVLTILLLYRILGIVLFYLTKYKDTYIIFFDFFKEYLVLYLLFGTNIPNSYLILTIFLKIIYEYFMHKKHIFLALYKSIFE